MLILLKSLVKRAGNTGSIRKILSLLDSPVIEEGYVKCKSGVLLKYVSEMGEITFFRSTFIMF